MGYVCPPCNQAPSGPTVFRLAAGRCPAPAVGQMAADGAKVCDGLVCATCSRCQHCGRWWADDGALTPVQHVIAMIMGRIVVDGISGRLERVVPT